MENEERIVSYSMDELKAMVARGEDETDWERVRTLTDEEIEASIDFEEEGTFDFDNGRGYHVEHEQRVSLLLDDAVVDWFRDAVSTTGVGYKTRIGEVLRDYVASQTAASPAPPAAQDDVTALATPAGHRRARSTKARSSSTTSHGKRDSKSRTVFGKWISSGTRRSSRRI